MKFRDILNENSRNINNIADILQKTNEIPDMFYKLKPDQQKKVMNILKQRRNTNKQKPKFSKINMRYVDFKKRSGNTHSDPQIWRSYVDAFEYKGGESSFDDKSIKDYRTVKAKLKKQQNNI